MSGTSGSFSPSRSDASFWKRLIRSAWSIAGAILVVVIVGALGVLLLVSEPLWRFAAPPPGSVAASADEVPFTAE